MGSIRERKNRDTLPVDPVSLRITFAGTLNPALDMEERILDALGNPVRRTILRLLTAGPCPVGEIADQLPVSRPAISKHLQILQRAELVTHQPKGNRNLFRLNPAGFEAARRWLDSFWDEALAGFKTVAEITQEQKKTA